MPEDTFPKPTYKPLGLTQVSEIRDKVDFLTQWPRPENIICDIIEAEAFGSGFDPSDVRQAAEEALENLRKGGEGNGS